MENNIIKELFHKGFTQKEIINKFELVGYSKEEATEIMANYQGVYKKGGK